MWLNHYPPKEIKGNKKRPGLWIFVLVVLLVVVLAASFIVSLFRASNRLMSRAGKELNLVAPHLMPNYTPLSFHPQNSALTLYGWLFTTNQDFRANVIMVHDQGQDKLQYDLKTVDLINFFLDQGFNVLAFDLRHSGESEGNSSAYGYAEYRDIIGAMTMLFKATGQKQFILYGVGTGTTAALFAWNELPQEISPEDRVKAKIGDPLLSRQDIVGLLLDTPVASAYDYIRQDLKQDTFLQKNFYARWIPDIIRMSSNGPDIVNLIPLIGHLDAPIFITRNLPDEKLGQASTDSFISECLRLKSASTMVADTPQAGHANGFLLDPQDYLEELQYFLDIWY